MAQYWCIGNSARLSQIYSKYDEIFYTVFGNIVIMATSNRKQESLSDIMDASADEVFGQNSAMVTAKKKKVQTEDIFVDRRKELVDRRELAGGIGYFNCRRQLKDRRRNKYVYDVREWWLRVNYVESDE